MPSEPSIEAWSERRAWTAKHGTPTDPQCVGALLANHMMDLVEADTRTFREIKAAWERFEFEYGDGVDDMEAAMKSLRARLAGRAGIGESES